MEILIALVLVISAMIFFIGVNLISETISKGVFHWTDLFLVVSILWIGTTGILALKTVLQLTLGGLNG